MLHANSIFVKFWDAEAEPRLALSIPLSHDFIIFSLSRDGTDRRMYLLIQSSTELYERSGWPVCY